MAMAIQFVLLFINKNLFLHRLFYYFAQEWDDT